MSEPVGADVESLCGKCGDTWHVVVAKMGDAIAKVQCKQCGGYHRHRPPGGAKPARRATASSRSPAAQRAKAAAESQRAEPLVSADTSQPPRPYSIREQYAPGQRIEHPTFGVGVVELVPEPGKMQVYFEGNRRILAQAKGGPKLEPPRHSFDDGR
jgi:hypothetical protein